MKILEKKLEENIMKFIPYVQMVLVLVILGLAGSAENNSISMTAFIIGAIALSLVVYGLQCAYNAYKYELNAKHRTRHTARVRTSPTYIRTDKAA